MPRFTIQTQDINVGGQPVRVRALTARERQAIAARCSTGGEMTNEAVLLCASDPADGKPFFADLSEVCGAPCGYIERIGEEVLRLSGMDAGDAKNPT